MPAPRLSIVVPLFNEEENLGPLVAAIDTALPGRDDLELLLVDDGSTDATAATAASLAAADPRIRLLRLARNYGQTQAIQAGIDHARGATVVTMDGDLQNDPADIPQLLAELETGSDMVVGYRVRRHARLLTQKLPSWAANHLIRWLTDVPVRDNGCTLKAFRRSAVTRLDLYSDMHRFIPVLAATVTRARIREVPVRHHARHAGQSKYGLARLPRVAADLITLAMIHSFREQPLRLYARWAAAALGAALLFVLAGSAAEAGARHALVFAGAALLCAWLALSLMLQGLVGEVAVRWHRGRSPDTAAS